MGKIASFKWTYYQNSLSAVVFTDRSTRRYLKSLANPSYEPNQEIQETKVKHINITGAY